VDDIVRICAACHSFGAWRGAADRLGASERSAVHDCGRERLVRGLPGSRGCGGAGKTLYHAGAGVRSGPRVAARNGRLFRGGRM